MPDLINGLFEGLGALFLLQNVLRLHKDKIVRGVHWLPTSFFMLWGYWNLFYYPHLNQWLSFFGGLAIVIVNTVWLGQMIFYLRKERYEQEGIASLSE